MRLGFLFGSLATVAGILSIGCSGSGNTDSEVVVYAALDREFSEPVLAEFTAQTGIEVRAKYDVESTKTVGLTEAILAEAARPRCDVFWNNEILHTLRLQERGLLVAYVSPAAKEFPAMFRAPDGSWHGFAARARVLLVNTEQVSVADRPKSILDLTNARWRGKIGIAKPLFGTTATHAACLFAAWGDDRAKEFFDRLKDNDVQILSGNKKVALAVSAGQLAWGLTDTDDAVEEIEKARPVAIVYPDQGEKELGTLVIPNSLAIIRGSAHQEAAKRLVDYLLSPEIETRLAAGSSAQIPLRPSLEAKASSRLGLLHPLRTMQVDFAAAAAKWDAASRYLRDRFTRE